MITEEQLPSIPGATVYGGEGEKVGKVGHVYLDDLTSKAEWFTISTGLFGTSQTFVPLACATLVDGDLHIPFDNTKIKEAPKVSADDYLEAAEESELYRYYDMEDARPGVNNDTDQLPRDFAGDAVLPADGGGETVARPLEDGVESFGDGGGGSGAPHESRTRLRKYVIVEEKKITVTISQDQIRIEQDVRVEREPMAGGEIELGSGALAPAVLAEESRDFVTPTSMPIAEAIQTLEHVLRDAQIAGTEASTNDVPSVDDKPQQ